ncbi:MAG: putative sulfate exporter family transporter [Desulfuromonadaceae bacterium]|nr:putative sulfate exporter family transporter [Desulfuromonadaceae bacterium]
MTPFTLRRIGFSLCMALCAAPCTGTATALVLGIGFSFVFGNPWPQQSARWSKIILQLSVVGLGFGIGLSEVIHTGKDSVWYSLIGILCTLVMGGLLGKLFKNEPNTSALIAFGTAICGGSAIAAMAPVIKARNHETAVALATVFTLNAVALLLFPWIGHLLHLDQNLFGTWAGLAIHDTSSVVGAASAYGAQALAIGTTVKLTRAIWIAPVVFITALRTHSQQKARIPLFIIGFMVAAAVRSALPDYANLWNGLSAVARQALAVTLFLVGAGLSREVLREVGVRPLLQGITLWLLVSGFTLFALLNYGMA